MSVARDIKIAGLPTPLNTGAAVPYDRTFLIRIDDPNMQNLRLSMKVKLGWPFSDNNIVQEFTANSDFVPAYDFDLSLQSPGNSGVQIAFWFPDTYRTFIRPANGSAVEALCGGDANAVNYLKNPAWVTALGVRQYSLAKFFAIQKPWFSSYSIGVNSRDDAGAPIAYYIDPKIKNN